jgi:hypothetical protein
MIAKIILGNSFASTVEYIMDEKKKAELIDSEGVLINDKQSITDSFKIQQEMKPHIKKPVYHIPLGFSPQDSEKCTNEFMRNMAKEYMAKMGITNTQYIIVRHYDKEHAHIHLCINRIDNDGKLISNSNDRFRNEVICKELTEKYGLHFAENKEQVNRHRLRGADKAKYEIYDALAEAIPQVDNWQSLSERLAEQNIQMEFIRKGKTTEIQGVRFSMGKYSFNGSKIDRECSYSKINQRLKANAQSFRIRETQSNFRSPNQGKDYKKPNKITLPGFNNIYSEEENISNNRKRKRGL